MALLKKLKDKTGTIHDLGDSRVDAFETELSGAEHNVPYSPAVLAKTNAIETSISNHVGNTANPHKVTKAQIGLANVENKSSTQIRSELTKENVTNALGYTPIDESRIGAANGVASLDASGRIPASQIPGGFDNIEEYDNLAAFPTTGEEGKIYVAKDTNLTYRWTGSQYVEISPSLALGETATTAYRGDRGKVAYDHSQVSGNSTIHHTHANKELLDTYKQTEADLANAVAKVHEHGNKDVLDGITSFDVANWNSKVSTWQTTPDNTHYPSEKLVKDGLDAKADLTNSVAIFDGYMRRMNESTGWRRVAYKQFNDTGKNINALFRLYLIGSNADHIGLGELIVNIRFNSSGSAPDFKACNLMSNIPLHTSIKLKVIGVAGNAVVELWFRPPTFSMLTLTCLGNGEDVIAKTKDWKFEKFIDATDPEPVEDTANHVYVFSGTDRSVQLNIDSPTNDNLVAMDANGLVKDSGIRITYSDIDNWNSKQNRLTFDTAPTAGSNNPVTSDGVKTAIDSVDAKGIVINEINGENVICFE